MSAFMFIGGLLVLLSGCGGQGCGQESLLLLPASCQEPAYSNHHSYYDDRHYAWTRDCQGVGQAGVLRIGAVLPTESLGCQAADGPCEPCVPDFHGDCPRTVPGLTGNHLVTSGDRPFGAGYFLSCEESVPRVAFFFQDQPDGPISTCTVDAMGRGACDDGCGLTLRLVDPAP